MTEDEIKFLLSDEIRMRDILYEETGSISLWRRGRINMLEEMLIFIQEHK